ncbi:IPTL-CTERM sorting domain-containing protein [Comamonas serinivorans]|nr:IPTL-CTERM sorting domain-containing protein [Comamonas serinivorans]
MSALAVTALLAYPGVAQAQVITTVAGTGTPNGAAGNCGSGLATGVNLEGIGTRANAIDAAGNLYITQENVICKVDTSGVITTVAGNGTAGNSGDGGPATSASFMSITALALDSAGNLYIGSMAGGVRKVDTGGMVTAVSSLNGFVVFDIAFDSAGNLYASQTFDNKIIKMDIGGTVTAVAGTGSAGYSGDGGAATSAMLDYPFGLAFDSAGNLYVADVGNKVVRKIDSLGIISSVPGGAFTGDMGTSMNSSGIAFDSADNLYISNGSGHTVLKVTPDGVNTIVVGDGTSGYSGDGGLATQAQLNGVADVAFTSTGAMYVVDGFNGAVRLVSFSNLAVTASLPATATIGMPYSGTITITNLGAGPANSAATLAVTGLPDGVTLGACNIASLAVGDSVTCTVSGSPTAAGTSAVTATATDTADFDPSNNSASASVTVSSAPVRPTATPVPTLSQWGVALMTLLLAAGGWMSRRASGRRH